MNIKSALKAIGYGNGDTTDLETFESARGLKVSDAPDAKTLKALASAAKTAANPGDVYVSGMKDAAVTAAQQNLKKLGYDVGPANGVMNEQLADAVAKFKAAHPELKNLGRYIGAPVSNAMAMAAVGSAPEKAPSASQALVFGEISTQGWAALFPQLQQQLASGKIAKGTSMSIGSYGADPKMAKDIDVLRSMGANVKYTPAFTLVPGKDPQAWAGIKGPGQCSSDTEAQAQGQELGRRFRDELDAAQKSGTKVDGWMLDELTSSDSQEGATRKRAFFAGVLEGISQGRSGPTMKGDVYLANLPLLVRDGQTPALQSFLKTLDATTTNVVQEEYPIFGHGKGQTFTDSDVIANAQANAANANAADTALSQMGAAGASLAKKTVAGMSPGHKPGKLHGRYAEDGRGGYRDTGLSKEQEKLWRKTYLDARERNGVAGLGEFGFVAGNTDPGVVDTVVAELAAEVS